MTIEDFLIENNAELAVNWKKFNNFEEKQNFVNKLTLNLHQQLSSQLKFYGLKIYSDDLAKKIANEIGEKVVALNHSKVNFNSVLQNAYNACENKLLLQLVLKNLQENGLACLEKENSNIHEFLSKEKDFNLDLNLNINSSMFFDALQKGTSNLEKTHQKIKDNMENTNQKIQNIVKIQTEQNNNTKFVEMNNLAEKISCLENEYNFNCKKLKDDCLKLQTLQTKDEKKLLKQNIKALKNKVKTQSKLLNSFNNEFKNFKDFNFIDDKLLEKEKQTLTKELEELCLIRNIFKRYIDFGRQLCRQNSLEK